MSSKDTKVIRSRIRKTIGSTLEYDGVGLHSGGAARMVIKPAMSGHGICFYRTDEDAIIPARLDQVSNTNRHTCITQDNSSICTIEHVLSALRSQGVTDAIVEVDAAECPILDGSAQAYTQDIIACGTVDLEGSYPVIHPQKELFYIDQESGGEYTLYPSDQLTLSVTIERKGTPIHGCTAELSSLSEYRDEIASSRTFVLYSDLIQLAEHGLVRGGALDTASVIFDTNAVQDDINRLMRYMKLDENLKWTPEMLAPRSKDEPARHKILDLLGDSVLLGMDICARIECVNPSHRSNIAFFRYLNTLFNA